MYWFSKQQQMFCLRIGLTTEPKVALQLLYGEESIDERDYSPSEIDAPSEIADGVEPKLTLPWEFKDALATALADAPKSAPLWLHFVKPYGYLGVQPWETELTQLLARPILRLPDLFERPPETRDVLEVAIIYDAGPRTVPKDAELQIKIIATAIAKDSLRNQTRVHLFPSVAWRAAFKEIEFDHRVIVYDPVEAAATAGTAQPFTNWSSWIQSKIGQLSLDAVHLVCAAADTAIGPVLRLSTVPDSSGLAPQIAVDMEALGAFLTRVGAWTAIFTPPPGDQWGVGLRMAADVLAKARPTTCVFQPIATADHALGFHLLCRFVFSPNPADPPKCVDSFVYCPPKMVAEDYPLKPGSIFDAMHANASLLERSSRKEKMLNWLNSWRGLENPQTPKWASAIQRHIESLTLHELRRQSPDILLSSRESLLSQLEKKNSGAADDGGRETLEAIQKIVADNLKIK